MLLCVPFPLFRRLYRFVLRSPPSEYILTHRVPIQQRARLSPAPNLAPSLLSSSSLFHEGFTPFLRKSPKAQLPHHFPCHRHKIHKHLCCLPLPPRPFTAPDMVLKKQGLAPLPGYKNERPSTTSLGERCLEHGAAGIVSPFRPNTRTRWRWRVGLTGTEVDARSSSVRTPSTTASRGRQNSRQSSPSSPSAIWGCGGCAGGWKFYRKERGRGLCCNCPMESCRGCSASKR